MHTTLGNPTWKFKNGGLLTVEAMSDKQLQHVFNKGIKRAARHFREEGLSCLAAAAGMDDGAGYFADVQSDEFFKRAQDPKELIQHLRKIPRYLVVLHEVRKRVRAKKLLLTNPRHKLQ